jgi:peptide/nickel transport system permease protein
MNEHIRPAAAASALPAHDSDRLAHWVSTRAYEPGKVEAMSPELERYYTASARQLMWQRFKRHRVALWSGIVLAVMYASILVTEVLAPYGLHTRNSEFLYAPPQTVRLFHEGSLSRPFVYPLLYKLNMETLKREYSEDTSRPQALRFFCSGDTYTFWGLFSSSFHVLCPPEGGTAFLLGTDRLGRDMLSRLLYGARISLTIGLVGVAISFVLGIVIGGIAGFFGGIVDSAIQRLIEILRSLPELPLWLALSAALPANWSPILVYFGITIILGLLEWPGLARAVRSKLLALRQEDFVVASRMMGAKPGHVIARHLLPNFMSHLIASVTLAIPAMILGETALSFLGLGLRPPITSWGVLLSEAQNIEAIALYPWLLIPMLPVIITTLAFNFFGDGLRDAADPYH